MNRRDVAILIASRGDLDESERAELAARMEATEQEADIGAEGWMLLAAVVLVVLIASVVFCAEFRRLL